MKLARFVALAIALSSVPAGAVSPKHWIHDTTADFLAGTASNVSITSDGSLRLAPQIETAAEPEAAYVWDVAVSGDTAYLGTGDDGLVIRVRGGESEAFFECAALEVLSMLVASDGSVWAGTAPEGFVYRIDAGTRDGEIVFDGDEPYVWDLLEGPDGEIYAALGPEARVVRIDPGSKEATTVVEIEDNHAVCLALEEDGSLLVGTEGKGLVLRVAPDNTVRVLYDAPEGEVGSILPGRDGEVWAAASSTAESREVANEATPNSNSDGSGIESTIDFAFEFTPPGVGDGVLYRIDREGNAIRFWESGQSVIFDLVWSPDGEDVLVGTGEQGHLYAVHDDGRATLVLDAEESQLVTLEPVGDALLLATADPPRLLRMKAGLASEGTYESQVLDARRIARWGRIEWLGEGNGVKLATRTGNTEEPDNTWTEWKSPGKEGRLDVEGSRFLQWRVNLSGGGGRTPSVRRVRVSSLENNLPPRIARVAVAPSGTGFFDESPEPRPRPLYQALRGGVKVQYSYDMGENEFPPEARAPWTKGLRQVRWEAVDPNADFLLFDLAFRRDDEGDWKEFATDIEGENFTFNSQGVPDGRYVIRVIASDRRHNPADERTASADSEPFIVDNTAPSFDGLKHRRDGEEVRVTGTVRDELSDVVRLEYSLNGDDWLDRGPVDGIFDSMAEELDVTVDASEGKEHSLLLRVTDLAGNLGTTRVLIRP